MDTMFTNGIQIVIGLFIAIGAWWCKGIAQDVRALELREQAAQVTLAGLMAGHQSREKLQDERWQRMQGDMESLKNRMEKDMHLLQLDVKALLLRHHGERTNG